MVIKNIHFDKEQLKKIEDHLKKKLPLNRNFSLFVREACEEKINRVD